MLSKETIGQYFYEIVIEDLIREITNIVNTLGLTDNDSYIIKEELDEDMINFLTGDGYDFLGKYKRTKEKVANKIIDSIMEMFK